MENGFAVCGSNLCSTQDGAATWKEIATPFSFKPTAGSPQVLQWDFIDATTGWAILDHDGGSSFIKTTDGGRTWIDLEPRLGF